MLSDGPDILRFGGITSAGGFSLSIIHDVLLLCVDLNCREGAMLGFGRGFAFGILPRPKSVKDRSIRQSRQSH